MTTLLPRDDDNAIIPALSLKSGGAHSLAAGATTARTASAFGAGARVISLYASEPVFLALGDDSVTATSSDHYFPAGVYYDISLGSSKAGRATHLAALRAGAVDATLYISEKV